jgi:imidazole glycerol-phosphate synthase subunit HisF
MLISSFAFNYFVQYVTFNLYMKNFRIIPRLDIKNGLLVKGINLEGLRVLGNPFDFAKKYYLDGADEICYVDIVSSLYGTKNLSKFVKKTAESNFIPLTVGGGIENLTDINEMLLNGADKICLNSAFVKNIKLLKLASKKFGSSTITAIVEITKIDDKLFITSNNGRELHHINPLDWIRKLQDQGAGEIIITSVIDEGLNKGFNLKILDSLSKVLKIPFLIHGGLGNKYHIYDIAAKSSASGVLISSFFHYNYLYCSNLNFKNKIGNFDYIANTNKFVYKKNVFLEIKSFLKKKKISVRL